MYMLKIAPTRNTALALLLAAGLMPLGYAQVSSPVPGAAHTPSNPSAAMPQRADVLPWSVLSDVKVTVVKKRALPNFPESVLALNDKVQRVQGFMMPLAPGERQTHFLLSPASPTCAFCMPGGPESLVEVTTKIPVKFTMEPLVVEGKFDILKDDPFGLYYRMKDARNVQ